MLTQGLLIRRLQAPDVHEILAIISESRTEDELMPPAARAFDAAGCNLFEHYGNRRSAYLVAVVDSRIVGGAGIARRSLEDPTGCELQCMYLQRGKRGLGIGYALLSRCLELACELGYATCYANTTPNMRQAQRLYERQGFQELGIHLDEPTSGDRSRWHWLSLYSKSDSANTCL
jgi:putative acetyltransferase